MQRRYHWAAVLAAQCLLQLLAASAAALTEWLPILVSNISLWALYPLLSALLAYSATRRGLNNYAAWIPAPALYPMGYYIVWGYLASPAPVFISALLAIIGAAAGDTKNRFERRRR